MAIPNVRVGYKLPNKGPVMWDLLSEEILKKLTINAADIKDVHYSDYYPGDIYAELGVARDTHPAMGSFSAEIVLRCGGTASVSSIWFQDFGHLTRPPVGTPHWNHQTRAIGHGWSKPQLLTYPHNHHHLPKTDYIDIIREGPEGRKQSRLTWKDRKP